MLDAHLVPKLKIIIDPVVNTLAKYHVTPNQVTVTGFLLGLLAPIFIGLNYPIVGLVFILVNRFLDGLDGALARKTATHNDAGGFLDICLDFLFYASIPLGFAFANPEQNALPAAILLTTFIGTGSSFLAFAISAEKFSLTRPEFAYKSFYYLNGLTEGTETILFFCAFCLWPNHFPILAIVFAILASITIFTRVYFGFNTLKSRAQATTSVAGDNQINTEK